jgi:hypothetical protein
MRELRRTDIYGHGRISCYQLSRREVNNVKYADHTYSVGRIQNATRESDEGSAAHYRFVARFFTSSSFTGCSIILFG